MAKTFEITEIPDIARVRAGYQRGEVDVTMRGGTVHRDVALSLYIETLTKAVGFLLNRAQGWNDTEAAS